MISLVPVTDAIREACEALDVWPDQQDFIASNAFSLAQADEEPQLQPLAILHDGRPVGFALIAPDPIDGRMWIARFMIDRNYQGQGLGSSALEILLSQLHSRHTDIWISYHPENHAARKLYAKYGFRETGEVEDGEVLAVLSTPTCQTCALSNPDSTGNPPL